MIDFTHYPAAIFLLAGLLLWLTTKWGVQLGKRCGGQGPPAMTLAQTVSATEAHRAAVLLNRAAAGSQAERRGCKHNPNLHSRNYCPTRRVRAVYQRRRMS